LHWDKRVALSWLERIGLDVWGKQLGRSCFHRDSTTRGSENQGIPAKPFNMGNKRRPRMWPPDCRRRE